MLLCYYRDFLKIRIKIKPKAINWRINLFWFNIMSHTLIMIVNYFVVYQSSIIIDLIINP